MVEFAHALLKSVECGDETITRLASRAVIYLIHVRRRPQLRRVNNTNNKKALF